MCFSLQPCVTGPSTIDDLSPRALGLRSYLLRRHDWTRTWHPVRQSHLFRFGTPEVIGKNKNKSLNERRLLFLVSSALFGLSFLSLTEASTWSVVVSCQGLSADKTRP